MSFQRLIKVGVAAALASGALVSCKTVLKDFNSNLGFSKPAFAATVESSVWNDDWDRRANEKPKVSRHIILIRHGQYHMDGKTDQDKFLTELGKEQANLTGKRLKDMGLTKKINIIFQSSMTRARETCSLIFKQLEDESIPVETCDALREGAPVEPEPPVEHWHPDPKTFFVDGSRIEHAFRKYMHRADADLEQDSVEVIVCHGNVIRYFVCRALQLPPEAWLRMSLRHASITQLTIRPSGRVSLKCLGDTGHMPADKLSFE